MGEKGLQTGEQGHHIPAAGVPAKAPQGEFDGFAFARTFTYLPGHVDLPMQYNARRHSRLRLTC